MNSVERTGHAFTVDVEDWYHGDPGRRCEEGMSRLANGLDRLLDLLQEHQCRGTFFWLGAAARDQPRLLRKVVAHGHEIGCHGHLHRPVHQLSAVEFRSDLATAADTIEQIGGIRPRGYRAPYFSLNLDTPWAFEILKELEFAYDSSVFPHRPKARAIQPLHAGPQLIDTPAGTLAEMPMSSCRWGPAMIPACGGAYFRAYPYAMTQRNLRWLERRDRRANFYIHPWELDPGHPCLPSTWKQSFAHHLGMRNVEAKMRRLMRDFRFTTLGEQLNEALADNANLPKLSLRHLEEKRQVPTKTFTWRSTSR